MSDFDPYHILEIDRNATAEQIRESYRRIVRECHPDLHTRSTGNEKRIREVNLAYGILGDQKKKDEFDRSHSQSWRTRESFFNGPSWSVYSKTVRPGMGPVEPEEIFGTHGNDFWSRIKPRKGSDLTHELRISFLQAFQGVTVEAEIAGKIIKTHAPAGVDTGTTIRLEGCGAPGLRGGHRGDLYLVIYVTPDPRFLRQGDDVFATVPISGEEARDGVIIEAPAPNGSVRVNIPPNTLDETMFRFRGRGFPSLHAPKRGDYFIRVRVV